MSNRTPFLPALLALVAVTAVVLGLATAPGGADEPPVAGLAPVAPASPAAAPNPAHDPALPDPAHKGRDLGHMHNVHQITPHFVRGSAPEGESDFALLKELGVKVVVSVDGARPDVAAAKKHGLRYVHVPIGYGGMTREQMVLLYKAFTTLEGPFYVHCHHGKHRGPAGCAVGLMGVDGWTAEQAVAELKAAGTSAKYDGLYAVPAQFVKPTAEELAAAPSEFPETAPIPAFQQAMVEIDAGWDLLGSVRKAGWAAPADHPDSAPHHEAVVFAEYLRELARREEVTSADASFQKLLGEGEQAAWDLAKALEEKPFHAERAEAAYQRVQTSCTTCHGKHRD